jgi:hypothetical protein
MQFQTRVSASPLITSAAVRRNSCSVRSSLAVWTKISGVPAATMRLKPCKVRRVSMGGLLRDQGSEEQ